MNALAWNKIIAALIIALLLYKGIEIYAEGAFEVAEPRIKAYVVEGLVVEEVEAVVAPEEVTQPVAPPEDVTALLAAASPEQGKRIFRRCQACHDTSQGGAHKIGPNLFAIIGAPVAQYGDYRYSDALAGLGGTWDFALMDDWLASPAEAVPGNKMSFGGMPKAGDRAALIAYLNSQSDNPLALPLALPVAAEPEVAEEVIEEDTEDAVTEEAAEETVVEDAMPAEEVVEEVAEEAMPAEEAVEEATQVVEEASEETATEPEAAPAETLEVDAPTDASEEGGEGTEEGATEDEDS